MPQRLQCSTHRRQLLSSLESVPAGIAAWMMADLRWRKSSAESRGDMGCSWYCNGTTGGRTAGPKDGTGRTVGTGQLAVEDDAAEEERGKNAGRAGARAAVAEGAVVPPKAATAVAAPDEKVAHGATAADAD